MSKAIALLRTPLRRVADPVEYVRATLVLGCGLALILAGPALPV